MATTANEAAGAAGGIRELALRSIKRNTKQYTMFLALVAIWVTFALLTEGVFLTPRNLSNLFVQTVTTAILAIGMVLVIVAGHIDLGVGSVLGFTGAVCAMLMIKLEWGSSRRCSPRSGWGCSSAPGRASGSPTGRFPPSS